MLFLEDFRFSIWDWFHG